MLFLFLFSPIPHIKTYLNISAALEHTCHNSDLFTAGPKEPSALVTHCMLTFDMKRLFEQGYTHIRSEVHNMYVCLYFSIGINIPM